MSPHLLLAVALTVGAPAPKEAPKKEPPTLVGEWVGETRQANGKTDALPARSVMTFTADGKMAMGEEGKKLEGTFTSDPEKTPGELNLMVMGPAPAGAGLTVAGIYKIEGDALTICMAVNAPRPTEFASPAGSAAVLVTFKRAKKD